MARQHMDDINRDGITTMDPDRIKGKIKQFEGKVRAAMGELDQSLYWVVIGAIPVVIRKSAKKSDIGCVSGIDRCELPQEQSNLRSRHYSHLHL